MRTKEPGTYKKGSKVNNFLGYCGRRTKANFKAQADDCFPLSVVTDYYWLLLDLNDVTLVLNDANYRNSNLVLSQQTDCIA